MRFAGFAFGIGLVLMLADRASAEFVQSEKDIESADSVIMVAAVAPDAEGGRMNIQLDLYAYNDGNNVGALGLGFRWDNPHVQMDSAVVSPLATQTFDFATFIYEWCSIDSTNTDQRFLFAGFSKTWPLFAPDTLRRCLASYYFTVSQWNASDSVVFDTITYSGGTGFDFVSPDSGAVAHYQPHWGGPVVVNDTPCCQDRVGDANCSGDDEPTIGDISAIIDYLFIYGDPLCCIAEADVDKSGGSDPTEEDITIGDIAVLQDYLFGSGDPELLQACY